VATEKADVHVVHEYWQLLRSPVFRGHGVTRGNGSLVLILPGLFGNDIYLQVLHNWLQRMGYNTMPSTLLLNAGCSDRLLGQVDDALQRRLKRHKGDLIIVGHSRGGMIGKALLSRRHSRCTHFVALGSPLGAILRLGRAAMQPGSISANMMAGRSGGTAVMDAGRRAMKMLDPDCNVPLCNCSYLEDLLAPMPSAVRTTAIYSHEDAIIPPEAAHLQNAENIEVSGTHTGLVFNQQVFEHLGRILSAPSQGV
jgi:triacylglycerol lipase